MVRFNRMKKSLIVFTLLQGATGLAAAQNSDFSDHACVRELTKWVTFNEPDTIKVTGVSVPKLEIIDFSNARLPAYAFTVMVNSKNPQGMYAGARPYTCHTSEDRMRVLKFAPRHD